MGKKPEKPGKAKNNSSYQQSKYHAKNLILIEALIEEGASSMLLSTHTEANKGMGEKGGKF